MDFKGAISTDTRRIGRGDVFFALKGERFDGHDFISEAVAKGASTVVYSDEAKAGAKNPGVSWVRVDDTLKAYGDRAAEVRRKSGARVVAVTGSSGKTTVKEMLARVLGFRFKVHKNQGTENNLVGVPKTIFGLQPEHEILILELGTNHPGEIARLSEIAGPDVAAITRVGASHLEGLGSIEGVRVEKLSIARGLKPGGMLWVNGDDAMLAEAGTRRVGLENPRADLRAEAVEAEGEGLAFRAGQSKFRLRLLGRHNILNALIVIGIARELGMDDAAIAAALETFEPVAGRLQVKRFEQFTFLDDTYNANPVSFEAAIGALADFPAKRRRVLVAGDMLELGAGSEAFHRALGRRAHEKKIDCLITSGERSRSACDEALKAGMDASRVCACGDAAQAGEALRAILQPGDVVLVKGSRGMKMEKVFECFSPSFTR